MIERVVDASLGTRGSATDSANCSRRLEAPWDKAFRSSASIGRIPRQPSASSAPSSSQAHTIIPAALPPLTVSPHPAVLVARQIGLRHLRRSVLLCHGRWRVGKKCQYRIPPKPEAPPHGTTRSEESNSRYPSRCGQSRSAFSWFESHQAASASL